MKKYGSWKKKKENFLLHATTKEKGVFSFVRAST